MAVGQLYEIVMVSVHAAVLPVITYQKINFLLVIKHKQRVKGAKQNN